MSWGVKPQFAIDARKLDKAQRRAVLELLGKGDSSGYVSSSWFGESAEVFYFYRTGDMTHSTYQYYERNYAAQKVPFRRYQFETKVTATVDDSPPEEIEHEGHIYRLVK